VFLFCFHRWVQSVPLFINIDLSVVLDGCVCVSVVSRSDETEKHGVVKMHSISQWTGVSTLCFSRYCYSNQILLHSYSTA
jgi:hypothetical protein